MKEPIWQDQVLDSGADKDVFRGTFNGKPVAVCVAKGAHAKRIQNEIDCFRAVGQHSHIIQMLHNGVKNGRPYLALEIIEPIGWDLGRLRNLYAFAGQLVPSALMARIFHQLVSALGHMHGQGFIHRDLKTQNVLVDDKHQAKLIDMGIACAVGTKEKLVSAYLAPELCEGRSPLGPAVDSWGLGLILHQLYQNQWNLLDVRTSRVHFNVGKPSNKQPMEQPVKRAMLGLLQLPPERRWSLKRLMASTWLRDSTPPEVSEEWCMPMPSMPPEPEVRRHLQHYTGSKPPPTALAVYVSRKNHAHLIGHPISELGLSILGITVLLINYGSNNFERLPCADTMIQDDSWLYFGIPHGEKEMAEAVAGLEKTLKSPHERQPSFRAVSRQEVIDMGKLVEFTMEYDCFFFPSHIGPEAVVGSVSKMGHQESWGKDKLRALNLRRIFKINLVGILHEGEDTPDWFPRAGAVVRPGDLGLIVRMPASDGSTQPTLTDDELEALMEEEQFARLLGDTGSSGALPAQQHSSTWHGIGDNALAVVRRPHRSGAVPVWDQPVEGAVMIGAIPSSSQVTVSDEHVEYVYVTWQGPDKTVKGWAEHTDVHPASSRDLHPVSDAKAEHAVAGGDASLPPRCLCTCQ